MPSQLKATETGWRIGIAYRGLIDLAPMREADTQFFVSKLRDGAAPTITSARLSSALPGKLVTKYGASVDPVLKVAPVPMLVEHLKSIFESGCSWRVEKALVRLRCISHAAWHFAELTTITKKSFALGKHAQIFEKVSLLCRPIIAPD